MSEKAKTFLSLREWIDKEILTYIPHLGKKTKLRDACEYALTNGGKRFRPLIVLLTAEALGDKTCPYHAALSVEFFHTASLIADDLPCMDNDDQRRDKPSLHKVFGESVALLASYALITSAFELIHKGIPAFASSFQDKDANAICSLALESAAACSGILGATGGQFLDLFPQAFTLEVVKEVIYKKTVTLFEVSFLFGWLFGGGDIHKVDLVKKTAYHLGMAFQIADDLGDLQQDAGKERKINIALALGKERAFSLFTEEMKALRESLEELRIYSEPFQDMCGLLEKSISHLQV
ncbi:MAG: polyprenyl synthetase family protein [Chlamydiae bacterium]|nr:polyprenyl synthetase family protein [Chlamydiota bacterium]